MAATDRVLMYWIDLQDWGTELMRFVVDGEERPPFVPPSPRRVTVGYWDDRRE